MKDIPTSALSNFVEVDNKGKFTFKKIVYMIVNGNQGNMLVSAEAKDGQVSGSAQVGDQRMTIHAEFDPNSGSLKAGYSMETVVQPVQKTVKVKEDAQRINVLPLQFLDLLVLPAEEVQVGTTVAVKMMEYEFTTKMNQVQNNIASLELNIKTDRSKGSSTDMMTDMMKDSDMDMDMDMGGMDMNMGGMDMGSMTMEAAAPKMDMNGDISYKFDLQNGIFNSMQGTLDNSIKSMGLDLKVKTNLQLTLIK